MVFSNFQILLGEFEEIWNFFAIFVKDETNLLGLLVKKAGCKRFVMRAVKKYWKGRQHCRAAFVLHQNTRKFHLKIVVCYFRKSVQCEEGRDGGGGGGGGVDFLSRPFFRPS